MAKDPAFLFYPGDWLGGTLGMTFEEKGAYMELLMLQFNRGHMTEHMIGQIVGQIWVNLKVKFVKDEDGLWYNVRLDQEKLRRKAYSDSRKNNKEGKNQYSSKDKKLGHMTTHMTGHMENENEIEDIVNYLNIKAEKNFKKDTALTIKTIKSRIKEGYSVEQFKKVIDIKVSKWKSDSKMQDYLRPETLFGSKFESYLNELNPSIKTEQVKLQY